MKQELFVDWSPDSRDHAALLRSIISDNTARGGPSGHRNVAIVARNADTGEVSSGGYEKDRFFGQARNDTVTTTDSRIKYMLNRFGAVSLFHRYTQRNSNIPTFSFDKHQVGINVTAQF
jgi:hypothetical protein